MPAASTVTRVGLLAFRDTIPPRGTGVDRSGAAAGWSAAEATVHLTDKVM
jgi:hypothetical protein